MCRDFCHPVILWTYLQYPRNSPCEALIMMTSSYGKIFGVTGPLWGESTGHGDAGDIRRDGAHYDVTVIYQHILTVVKLFMCD